MQIRLTFRTDVKILISFGIIPTGGTKIKTILLASKKFD